MKKTALIMAGGKGERFWPKSRVNLPKQFLSLTNDGKTMIQLTVERIRPLVELEDIFIATNSDYKQLVKEQLPGLPEENILCEPIVRNTAPCIGLGAVHIAHKYDDALMIVLPSDHLIKCNDIFCETLEKACATAAQDKNLVTIGITPNYPETGYGYIKMDRTSSCGDVSAVERFVEKPNYDLARQYVDSGEYFWNSGMFIWKISSILSNMEQLLPNTYTGLMDIQNAIGTDAQEAVLQNIFPGFTSVSIDYGIMERAENIYIVPGSFGWDDVGSWLAIERIRGIDESKNTLNGNVITVNTSDCTIEAADKLIAAVGLEHIVVVDTPDATLICSKDATNDIKKVLEQLRHSNKEQYL